MNVIAPEIESFDPNKELEYQDRMDKSNLFL